MSVRKNPALSHRSEPAVRPSKHRRSVSNANVAIGATHLAGMIASLLVVDKMKEPAARWTAIAGFGIATGIGEAIWREHIERKQERSDRER